MKRSGPGTTLCTRKTASIIAVSSSPGMPSASIGISAAGGTALFVASETMMPSGAPLPNLWPSGENRLATT